MTDGFTRRKEQSKEDIRKAAWDLFSQFGVERVSIADIARKAGVAQATIYNNFGSKEALVREFVTAVVNHHVCRAQEVLSPDKSYWEKMAAFIEFIFEMMVRGGPSDVDVSILAASSDLQNDPEISKIRELAQDRMADLLLGLVQEGKELGQITRSLSDEAYRIYFIAFMDVFTDPKLQHRFRRDPNLAQELGLLMMFGLGHSAADFPGDRAELEP